MATVDDPQERFGFGQNWRAFLHTLTPTRIDDAVESLKEKLGLATLEGKVFLDVGCGSGLFSLAAHRLGAHVHSFDYDVNSVACAQFLKETYAKDASSWTIQQGSVLDEAFLKQFGQVDILYSWGVLHHTGHMYTAFENVAPLVKEDGSLFIAIYNDQGAASKRWYTIKRAYNDGGRFIKKILTFYTLVRHWALTWTRDLLSTGNPLHTWKTYGKKSRGMSAWYDVVDWVGGYPFEVAKPEEVFDFFRTRGFDLTALKTCGGGIGCNEFVFRRARLSP